jgi:hypothetical protein
MTYPPQRATSPIANIALDLDRMAGVAPKPSFERGTASGSGVLERCAAEDLVNIEIEVDTLDQLAEALAVGLDAVLLDNMMPEAMRRTSKSSMAAPSSRPRAASPSRPPPRLPPLEAI